MFDFSDCSVKSIYYDDSNALVIGKMRDEMGNIVLNNFLD